MTTPVELMPRPTVAVATAEAEWSVERIVEQTRKIQECMKAVMKKDEHYGVIPGTGSADRPPKPTLLKPGAEKLCLMFRLDPEYDTVSAVETQLLFSYTIRCTLFHIPTGARVASGLGSCNSRETKYVRPAPKKCPTCNSSALIVGKPEYERDPAFKGGWICYQKKGGCGAKYKPGDEAIEKQPSGIADPSDLANTILKMACKRALIAAVLNGTAASDCFTQDLEDLTEKAAEYQPPATGGADPKAQGTAAAAAGPRSVETPVPSASAKAPRANTVKHDGTFASPDQVKLLHTLRSKVGGLTVCKSAKACEGMKVCGYHRQLAAFKDCDDKPIASSKDLGEGQISNLIDRYKAKIKEQERRAQEAVSEVSDSVAAEPTDEEALESLRNAMVEKNDEDILTEELCNVFAIPSLDRLPPHEHPSALALIMAWNTKAYPEVLARVRP